MNYSLTTFDDLAVGHEASLSKTITEEDLEHFIAITGDTNPLHVDDEFARQTFFGERIAHGMLSASLFSTLVGLHIPGVGAIYRSQSLEFLRPVYIGDTITARFRVTAIDRVAERVEMESWIDNQHGHRVIEGKTVATLLRGLRT